MIKFYLVVVIHQTLQSIQWAPDSIIIHSCRAEVYLRRVSRPSIQGTYDGWSSYNSTRFRSLWANFTFYGHRWVWEQYIMAYHRRTCTVPCAFTQAISVPALVPLVPYSLATDFSSRRTRRAKLTRSWRSCSELCTDIVRDRDKLESSTKLGWHSEVKHKVVSGWC